MFVVREEGVVQSLRYLFTHFTLSSLLVSCWLADCLPRSTTPLFFLLFIFFAFLKICREAFVLVRWVDTGLIPSCCSWC